MYGSFYESSSHLLDWPILAMGIFLAVFTAIVVSALRRRPAAFEAVARLPLESERPVKGGRP